MTSATCAGRFFSVVALGAVLLTSPVAPCAAADKKPKSGPPANHVEIPVTLPTLNVPPPEVLLVMIRMTMAALSHAVDTGNFTVLRDLGSPALQAANSPSQLGLIFADLQNRKIDLSPAVVVTPKLTESPTVTPQNVLRLVGYFPTTPLQIKFQMLFQPVNGQWRLLTMSVYCVSAPGTPAPDQLAPATTGSIPPPEATAEHPMRPRSAP